ncbi:MAG: flavoprotein [bacterium]|nr:flavoprotein [bacterium]
MRTLIGITGSVAATLAPKLVSAVAELGAVEVVATKASLYFFKPADLPVPVLLDEIEWPGTAYVKGQRIPHVLLRDCADVLLIAPLTADTLAKLAHGRADNLLTAVVRAWDMKKPLVLAPAMNTKMWEHPATAEHLATLKRWYGDALHVIPPVSKMLACGDEGMGAMAPIETIVEALRSLE